MESDAARHVPFGPVRAASLSLLSRSRWAHPSRGGQSVDARHGLIRIKITDAMRIFPRRASSSGEGARPGIEGAGLSGEADTMRGMKVNEGAPDFEDVINAAERIAGSVMLTPCVASETLSRLTGCRLSLKFENLQFTASFKERGALNKLLSLTSAERTAGVIAASAGNHAQGVAYHAHRLGVAATIVMPRGTPATKISRTREHGATVILEGPNLTAAMDEALTQAEARGLTFVHPYDDREVIAGQGTLGLEMLEAVPDADTLVVPIGGGGLISGIAIAARQINPAIRIIGVQVVTYPSMLRALAGEWPVEGDSSTIAEGIAVKQPGRITRGIVRDLVDEILLVEEASIERAVALLLSVEKTVVEGAGAAGLAAILQYPGHFAGRNVVTPLCGGNIDLRILSSVAMRELVRSGQLLRFDVPITDQPGALSGFSAALAEAGANILDVAHDRLSLSLNPKGAVLDVVIEVQDRSHGAEVVERLGALGFDVTMKAL